MKEGNQIEFQQWEGTGNTFVVIDDREDVVEELENEVVQRICSAHDSDGMIFVRPAKSPSADLFCDFRNPDGSRSFCGNGTRATYAYARREGWVGDEAVLEACDGLHKVRWNKEYSLPSVQFESVDTPSNSDGDWFVNTGSPHHIIIVSDTQVLESFDIEKIGAEIRYSQKYESIGGTNVSGLARTPDPSTIHLRTYERGVEAETRACGTGAVAAALIDHTDKGGETSRKVVMPGGDLYVEFEEGVGGYRNVWLSGKASEMKRGVLTLCLAICAFLSPAQASTQWYDNLSDEAIISVLTASPGDDIYSLFGHSAIRILDPQNLPDADWVFNYGTFSFSDGFYFKFIKGRLDYKLSVEPYYHFHQVYHSTERGLISQTLDLTPEQVRSIAKYLAHNVQPQNATYSYEFFRDNCATRVLTVLESTLGAGLEMNCAPDGRTYRDGLKPYLRCSPWTEFGMDFILGPKADAPMLGCASSYIPDDLSNNLKHMTLDGKPLAFEPEEIIIAPGGWIKAEVTGFLGLKASELAFLLLSILVVVMRFVYGDGNLLTKVFVKTINVVLAALGVLLLLMWVFTDHVDTWSNWNLIWTIPALATLLNRDKVVLSIIALALYLLVAPIVWPQYVSLSLWLVAISLFLTLTPKLK